jgi:hypothetical protein
MEGRKETVEYPVTITLLSLVLFCGVILVALFCISVSTHPADPVSCEISRVGSDGLYGARIVFSGDPSGIYHVLVRSGYWYQKYVYTHPGQVVRTPVLSGPVEVYAWRYDEQAYRRIPTKEL